MQKPLITAFSAADAQRGVPTRHLYNNDSSLNERLRRDTAVLCPPSSTTLGPNLRKSVPLSTIMGIDKESYWYE
ncbi:MAG: hypothetical protein L0154_28150 [Chloroflexi bacterium]|nr:hypothetical protein [Chloroflexota bacterium]